MSSVALEHLLARGEELFVSLEALTNACLSHLEMMQADEIKEFLSMRQTTLNAIEDFCGEFEKATLTAPAVIVDEFRLRQAKLLQRVIAADGLITGISRQEMESLQTQLAEIARGRSALLGYNHGEGAARTSMMRSV
jgi:hypothetical protein